VNWRVGLIDSCGIWPGAIAAAAFATAGRCVEQRAVAADSSGHGSRVARLLLGGNVPLELLLAQVFVNSKPTTGAAVAAAIDWVRGRRANLIHLSLGLAADRSVLATAVASAIDAGCIVVASTPARGAPTYPAAYPGVIRATGDARCAPSELSWLGPSFFGGCPRIAECEQIEPRGGASIGAAWVSRAILSGTANAPARAVVATLAAGARHIGPERKGRLPDR
jgi:hypothetical protein